jgi:hypothetical protein
VTSTLSLGALSARILFGAALTATTVLAGPALASAAPGDNGTVKIHDPNTDEQDNRNEPHVCEFQIVASNFDAVQDVDWKILTQGGRNGGQLVEEGSIVLDGEGAGSTEVIGLENGHYRLNWTFEGQKSNSAKHKVFWVECDEEQPTEEPTDEPTDEPTGDPTDVPTEEPSGEPTGDPTVDPSEPGAEPTDEPTDPAEPTDGATDPAESEAPTAPADESGTPGGGSGGLPVTGGALAGLVAAGAVAVAGGGAAVYYSRKRRGNGDDAAESTEG